MIQLRVLSGKLAGTVHAARQFPFTLGRGTSTNLQLEEDGVWDQHARLNFDRSTGITLSACQEALISVNGKPCREAVLRNGDELALGALRLRFSLGPTRQRNSQVCEWLTWIALVAITAGQVVLIYHLAE